LMTQDSNARLVLRSASDPLMHRDSETDRGYCRS
jgi:hypothetical protein